MSGSAHMAMGVFIGAMVVYVARPKVVESAVIFGITTTAILLPDIDEPRSKRKKISCNILYYSFPLWPSLFNTFTIFISYSILLT